MREVNDDFFRYDIELTQERNPPDTPDTLDRFREDLRTWFVERGLNYGMGALGGGVHCYGGIGPNPQATEEDRSAMADWIRQQRICATVRLDAIVPFDQKPDILSPITDWVFLVDNLTEADQQEAAAFHAAVRRKIEAWQAKRKQP